MISSLPLFSFIFTLLLVAAVCTHVKEQVKDNAGNPIHVHEKYFIQPVKTESNNGGGLVPAAINILPFCPLGIIQTLLPSQPGLPVSFSFPYMIPDTIIETSSYINIEFVSDNWPVCSEFSKLWAVDDSLSALEVRAIIIGGKPRERNSAFKIEKAEEGENIYKLTTSTGTIGAIPGAWSAPQLVLTNDDSKTLLVKFVKVGYTTTSTSRAETLGLKMFPFY